MNELVWYHLSVSFLFPNVKKQYANHFVTIDQ